MSTKQGTAPGLDENATLEASGDAEPGARSSDDRREIQPGAPVGRYLVVAIAGHGGMGVVYRAYDPELQREVALKLLRASTSSDVAGARLRREAQAMAKVSHPNVLPVYDAGELEGRLWIAMEFLAAPTLDTWLRTEKRSWREIVAMFVQAGRGLAAAHGAGLVHRDFKPHNVLVGPDGRARVMDFGLARPPSVESIESESAAASPSVTTTDFDLTAAGSTVGTPRYMAPEQHHGAPIDGRADQFAFCVALFEALYRVRAFSGDSIPEIALRKHAGRLTDVTDRHDVPVRLHRVLLRGLAPDPAERYAAMDDLLAALEHDPSVQRKRWIVGGSALALILVGGTTAGALWSARARPCQDAARKLEGVWDESRRENVAAAMRGTGMSYAADVETRTFEVLDTYADAWVDAHNAACAATEIHGEQSVALLDLRIACLDRARAELGAFVDVIERADATVLGRARRGAAALRPIAQCDASPELAVRAHAITDPEDAAELARLDGVLAQAGALVLAGKAADAADVLEPAIPDARALGSGALLAELLRAHSGAISGLGDHARAREIAIEALATAMASNAQSEVVATLVDLVYYDGNNLGAPQRAREWARLADALMAQHGSHALAISLLNARSITEIMDGRFELGQQLADQAIAHAREHDPDNPQLSDLLGNFGGILAQRGKYEGARAYFEQAVELSARQNGDEHPDTLRIRANQGTLELFEGHTAAAIEVLAAVSNDQARVLGETHPDLAISLNNLAAAYRRRGDAARAIDVHLRVLALRERVNGASSLQVAQTLDNLAIAYRESEELDEARKYHDRAKRIREALLAPDHPDLALGLVNESTLCRAERDIACAHAAVEKGLALRRSQLGLVHPLTIAARVELSQVLLARGERDEAIAELERVLADARGEDVSDSAVGAAMFELAVLVPDRARARDLATAARSLVAESGDDTGLLEDIDAWLATHR